MRGLHRRVGKRDGESGDLTMRRAHLLSVLLLALVCGGPSCGGSDSSGPELLLSGSYHLVGFSAETDGTPQAEALWGTLLADGRGRLSLDAMRNRNGDVTGPDLMENVPYAVDADRSVRVLDAADPSVQTAAGKISPEGDVCVLGSSAHDRDPGFWIAVRKGRGLDLMSIEGRYHGCLFQLDHFLPANKGTTGSWEFDGLGNFTCTTLQNKDGGLDTYESSGPYTVSSDGTVSLTFVQYEMFGGMLQDGRLIVLAGGDSLTSNPGILVLIRATPISESWDAQYGDHFIAGIERVLGSGAYRSRFGTFTIVDNIDTAVAWSQNQEGIVTPLPPWTGTWASDPDAGFGFFDPASTHWSGGLEQTGRYAVVGGSRTNGGNPGIFFLVR